MLASNHRKWSTLLYGYTPQLAIPGLKPPKVEYTSLWVHTLLSTLYPPPSTLYPLPSTLYPLPSTLNPRPSTLFHLPSNIYPPPSNLYAVPSTLSPLPSTLYPQPSILHPLPSTLNPLLFTLNPLPSTLNPLLFTLNPLPTLNMYLAHKKQHSLPYPILPYLNLKRHTRRERGAAVLTWAGAVHTRVPRPVRCAHTATLPLPDAPFPGSSGPATRVLSRPASPLGRCSRSDHAPAPLPPCRPPSLSLLRSLRRVRSRGSLPGSRRVCLSRSPPQDLAMFMSSSSSLWGSHRLSSGAPELC